MSDNACKEVFIIAGETGSGKTSFLLDLVEQLRGNRVSLAGFAALSVPGHGPSGAYHLLDLASGKILPLASRSYKEGWEQFGPFFFNPEGIRMGKNILEDPLIISHELIIVDEIGPFELQGKIWAGPLTRLLARQFSSILLVVRAPLLGRVMDQWHLGDAIILDPGRQKPGQAVAMILSKKGGTRPPGKH